MIRRGGFRASASWAAVGAVALWLTVVALGSTLVWLAISRAGDDVVGSAGPGTVGTAPGTSGSPRANVTTSDSSPTATTSSPSPSSSSASSDPTDEPSETSTATASGEAERRTWQGTGGLVEAECRGSAISFEGGRPDNGYRIEVDKRGPDEVRVEFEGQGDSDGRTKVRADCQGGVPVFDVEVD